MEQKDQLSAAAAALGSVKSERKAASSRANGRLGGRPRTIVVEFDAGTLPAWARKHPEIIELCRKNLAFRINVFDAKHADYKRALIRQAERLAGKETK